MKTWYVRGLTLVGLSIFILSGCSGQANLLTSVTPTSSNEAAVPDTPTAPSPTSTQTVSIPDRTPTITPTVTTTAQALDSVNRPPSGWSIFSNPDYVKGIALYENHLWAATLGGVVDWNIDTKTPVVYTTRDGLVEIQGNDIVICPMPEERVLVAHDIGMLSAYDLGLKKWSRIPITFADGSTLKGVQALRCDAHNNRLLVGSSDGLGILDFKTGRWKHIGPAEGLSVDIIRAIEVVGQTIWVAAGKQGAFMIVGNTIFPFNGASGFPSGSVNDVTAAADASVWFGYPTGLVHYKDKKWNSYGGQTSAGIPFLSVDQVEVGPNNSIWIASSEEGVCPFNPVTLFCATIYPAPEDAPVTDLVVGEDGTAYAATDGAGILVLRAEERESLLVKRQNLISNDILDLAESLDGRIWVATDKGVNSFDPFRTMETWQTILPERGGLMSPRIAGLLPVPDGMWFFYDQEPQVSFYNGDEWEHWNSSKGLSGPVLDAVVDWRGYIWFATQNGLDIWDGVAMRSYGPNTGLAGNVYHTLLEKNGVMWVGTDLGLLSYERYQWKVVLPGISVNAIISDAGNGLLLGTDQGLIRFDGQQGFQWIINLGDESVMNPHVTTLAQDHRGNLWVGTDQKGVFYYNGTYWVRFDTASGMPTNHIRKIITDQLGAVWIAATTGQGGGALVRFVP